VCLGARGSRDKKAEVTKAVDIRRITGDQQKARRGKRKKKRETTQDSRINYYQADRKRTIFSKENKIKIEPRMVI